MDKDSAMFHTLQLDQTVNEFNVFPYKGPQLNCTNEHVYAPILTHSLFNTLISLKPLTSALLQKCLPGKQSSLKSSCCCCELKLQCQADASVNISWYAALN